MSLVWLHGNEAVYYGIAGRMWVNKSGRMVEQMQTTLDDYAKQ